jgi:hypothetical protein
MFNENTRNILLNGSEQDLKEFIMSLSQPDAKGYRVAVDFLLFKYNEKLVKKTLGLVIATWVLAILNGLLIIISFSKYLN